MSENYTILVTGATGNVGRHVVEGLRAAGVRVRAMTRRPERADLPLDVELVAGEPSDADVVAAAAQHTDACFWLWPGLEADAAAEPLAAAARSTRHVVYLSAADLSAEAGGVQAGVWADIERLVRTHGESWTFVRAGGFAANTLGWAPQIAAGDVVRIPFPFASRSLVHERDIAAVAVRSLVDPALRRSTPVVTGPRSLTQVDQVRVIAETIGRPLTVEEQPPDEALAVMSAAAGEEFARRSLDYWQSLIEQPERVSADVERLTDRPAADYRHWVKDHAESFTHSDTA